MFSQLLRQITLLVHWVQQGCHDINHLIDIWYLSDIFEQNIKQNITVCKYCLDQCLQLKLSCTIPHKNPFLLPVSHIPPGTTLSVYRFSVCAVWSYLYWNICPNKCFKFYVFDQKIKNIKISKISDINQNIKISWYFPKYRDIFHPWCV